MGSDLFVTLLFGKSSGLATLVIGQANQLRTLSYSRSLEKEADLEGYKLLRERGIDPGGYDRLFKHLKDSSPGTEIPEMISSHPDTDNRMQYIREAARGQVVKEDPQLRSIFAQLKTSNMILTTTASIEGRPVQEYLGVINAQSIIGANMFKDIFAGLRDLIGGRSKTYERVIEEAKEDAMRELTQKAQSMGANAVVGIDLDFETVGASGSMLMVIATGTAVRI